MKRFLAFALMLFLPALAQAGITVVRATDVSPNSYVKVYKATFSTSATLATRDSIVIVAPDGGLFDLSTMQDSLISIYVFHKTGTDSSHIKVEMAATYLPSARITTAYAGYEWKTMATKSDSDAASYYHDFVTNKNTAGMTQFVPFKVRFSVIEYLGLNEYITASQPATVWISWRKKTPVSR